MCGYRVKELDHINILSYMTKLFLLWYEQNFGKEVKKKLWLYKYIKWPNAWGWVKHLYPFNKYTNAILYYYNEIMYIFYAKLFLIHVAESDINVFLDYHIILL